MSETIRTIKLCVYSEAVGGRYETAYCQHQHDGCPLGLNRADGQECDCRQRTDVGRIGEQGLKRPAGTRQKPCSEQHCSVLACLFPETWYGQPVRSRSGMARFIRQRRMKGLKDNTPLAVPDEQLVTPPYSVN